MDTILTDLEKGLTTQLSALADEIRLGEEKLMRNKEGYLKVQGALEILTVIKKQQSEKSEKELKEALTTAGLD
jgi:hypothetical protein